MEKKKEGKNDSSEDTADLWMDLDSNHWTWDEVRSLQVEPQEESGESLEESRGHIEGRCNRFIHPSDHLVLQVQWP